MNTNVDIEVDVDVFQGGGHHDGMPRCNRFYLGALIAILIGGLFVAAGGAQNFKRHDANSYLSSEDDFQLAQSIVHSPVAVDLTGERLMRVESSRYSLFIDTASNDPFLVYTSYNGLSGTQQIPLELFADLHIRAIWDGSTIYHGVYEGHVDPSQMQTILELLVRSGVVEPNGLLKLEQVPDPPDSPTVELKLRAEILVIKDSAASVVRHTPYENKTVTPLMGCDSASISTDAMVICNLNTLYKALSTLGLKLATDR